MGLDGMTVKDPGIGQFSFEPIKVGMADLMHGSEIQVVDWLTAFISERGTDRFSFFKARK